MNDPASAPAWSSSFLPLLALLVLGIASAAFALVPAVAWPQWTEIGTATDGTRAFVDVRSLTGGKDWVRLRQRFILPPAERTALARVEQDVVYRCRTRTVMTLRSTEYDGRGNVARTDGASALAPYVIDRGTLPEYVFDAVC